MREWKREPVSLAETSAVSDLLSRRGLRGTNIRIEVRHRRRLVFEFRCACGRQFEAECDEHGDTEFAIEAAWPRAHRGCAARAASERPAAVVPEGPLRKATTAQLRELQRDPFVREVLEAFYTPPRAHSEGSRPNVIGAVFPDGAVFRHGMGLEAGLVAVPWPDTPYLPGEVVKVPRVKWK